MMKIWRILTRELKVSKIYTLMGCFWKDYIVLELKKYRGVMFICTQDFYKVWRKTGLCFQKLTWGVWQIFTRALESLQIGTSASKMPYFRLKLKMYELYRGVMCHRNEKWCKSWKGIDLSVQNWHEEFDKFWPEHSKISKICTLMGFFWTKYIMFDLKKYRELCLVALNIDATFEGKLTCAFKNDVRNLANFHQSMLRSLKIGILMGCSYSK